MANLDCLEDVDFNKTLLLNQTFITLVTGHHLSETPTLVTLINLFLSPFVLITLQREAMIPEKNRVRIEKYITGIISKYSSKLYAIYANPEHVHMLVSRAPHHSEEELVPIYREQESGAAFSVSKSGVDAVCKYIMNQGEHHRKESFGQEYDKYLRFFKTKI